MLQNIFCKKILFRPQVKKSLELKEKGVESGTIINMVAKYLGMDRINTYDSSRKCFNVNFQYIIRIQQTSFILKSNWLTLNHEVTAIMFKNIFKKTFESLRVECYIKNINLKIEIK